MTQPFLPIGVQDFETLRTRDFICVDKIRHLHQMIRPGQGGYFLSRPRRFGKSLTLSTLRCLFQGKRDLFDEWWIGEGDRWSWEAHPVLTIDFNEIPHPRSGGLPTRVVHYAPGDGRGVRSVIGNPIR